MNSLGFFSLLATALELSVPAYGLRLVRRFGSRPVGWFLVTAFCSLALLHLVERLKTSGAGPLRLEMIVACASGLLLIGMGHIETLCAQRLQGEFEEHKLSRQWQLALKEKTADLVRTNQELLEENTRLKESQRVLRQSEQQYRFLFAESPQPMWIFHLRSLRFLAANRAALRRFGFASEEFTALTASRLLPAEAVPFFLQDVAEPCASAQSRGVWHFRKKDGTQFEVEITGLDLKYDGCPARLIIANEVTPHRRQELQQIEAGKIEALGQAADRVARSLDHIVPVTDSQAKLLSPKPPHSESIEELKQISARTAQGDSLMRQPLTLADRPIQPKPADLTLARASSAVVQKQSPPVTPPGAQTIMLVEPQDQTRGLARFILSRQGYRVIEADCSSTVLTLWENQAPTVDLLLTEVGLPEGISGSALADQLRQTKPDLKVVYTCAADKDGQSQELPLGQTFIPKPYTPDRLLQTIRNCLQN